MRSGVVPSPRLTLGGTLRALLAAAILAAAPAGSSAREGAVAFEADLDEAPARATLRVTLSDPVEPRIFVLDRPDRIVVELPGLNCQLPAFGGGRRGSLVTGVRCGVVGPGRSRLVVDLGAPATIERSEVRAAALGDAFQLHLVVARTDRASFARSARSRPAPDGVDATGSIASIGQLPGSGQAPMSGPLPELGQETDPLPLVVLDAGHGGVDPGARAVTGDNEKDIVLQFAQTLRERLLAGGGVRVLMTRDTDVFVPLDERVRIARAAGADLFVSIHADSITTPAVRGATVYTGAERATDLDSSRLAERENAADAAAGMPPSATSGVADILQDLTVRETRGLSHRFAGMLLGDMGSVTRFTAQPHREAGFRVLRAADMTSCLVELGYVSSPRDSDLLVSEGWRRKTAGAMAAAIERFFAPRALARAAMSP